MTTIGEELAALGRAIRRERERKGMAPVQLAEAAGVSRRRLAALEAGRLDPRYDVMLAVADGLDIDLGALVTRAEEPARQATDGREA
jgi:transcriptional regulator with XRE-family HTH domain